MHPTPYIATADTLDEFIARATPYLYTPRSEAYATFNTPEAIRSRYEEKGRTMVMVKAEHFRKDADPESFVIIGWPLPTW